MCTRVSYTSIKHTMSTKSRKSLSSSSPSWQQCDKCQCALMQKDILLHEANCPPSTESWNHSFISGGVLYSTIEVFQSQELPKHISERDANDMVFISQSAFQLCDIAIESPIVIATKDEVVVKTAWPTNEKSLTSVSLTKHAIELNNLAGLVKVYLLKSDVYIAKEIVINQLGKHLMSNVTTELDNILKYFNEQKIFAIGNRISVPYYGKKIAYKIVQIKMDEIKKEQIETLDENLSEAFKNINLTSNQTKITFYKALYTTKWTVLSVAEDGNSILKKKFRIEDIGGYSDLISDIRDVVRIGIGKYRSIKHFGVSKGILLYGPTGVGKSMIANAIISECNVNTFTVYSSDIYSKSIGETENKLKEIFNKAMLNIPSIILLEDIDNLCPKRSNSSTDHERRVLAQLITLFDDLQSTNSDIVIMATTSKLDFIDSSLRRPGRLDMEFEIYVPTPSMRTEILIKLLSKIPNTLSHEDIQNISFVTHGFVGADLYGLCSKAIINAVKCQKDKIMLDNELKITMTDFHHALITTKPSAMKEVLVEVSNVRWSDIGGLEDLKLKLKQAVEWPLRHPEAFARMGITPPRGVLMFGPPGCSKTMIAKALATESKVNFLNIKGPELFSKWVGESEKAVREIFRKARQVAPSIIFIDEIDALGGERGFSNGNGSNVQERVLAQLLTELDGVTTLGSVTLVAATNRPDKIDKALLRPGRLDRIIYVGLPDEETRREIFNIKLQNMPIAKEENIADNENVEDKVNIADKINIADEVTIEDKENIEDKVNIKDKVNIADLVSLTEGYTGAEIQAICHEAAMKALEENLNATVIVKEHFKAAFKIVTPRTSVSLLQIYENYNKNNNK